MRLSTQQFFLNGLRGITNASQQVTRTQEQIASGRRVLTPSDDPVAASRILSLESELKISDRYQRNIDNVESRLTLAETQLISVEDVVLRVRELVIQAGNGALTNEERQLIATEISQRLVELESLVNARDMNGDYLFSGFRTDVAPALNTGDGYRYEGDEGERYIQVSAGSSIVSNENGKALFFDIPASNDGVITSADVTNISDTQITLGSIFDAAAFAASAPDDYIVSFNPIASVIPPATNYSVVSRNDGRVIQGPIVFTPGQPIEFNGIRLNVSGNPVSGDNFIVERTPTQDMLTTVDRIARQLPSFTDVTERGVFIADALNNLDAIQASLLTGRSRIGARLNTLETTRATQESIDIVNQDILSELRDLDYAEAVSQLSFQSFVLEAAQQSYARIANLSLFNFLR